MQCENQFQWFEIYGKINSTGFWSKNLSEYDKKLVR